MSREQDTWKGWWERFGGWWDFANSTKPGDGSKGQSEQPGDEQRAKKMRNLVLLALLGAGMMMFSGRSGEQAVSTSYTTTGDEPVVPAATDNRDSTDTLESKVEALLAQIAGVGRVEVLIVPKTSDINVFAQEVTERTTLTQQPGDGRTVVTTSQETNTTRRPIIVNNDETRSQQPVVEYVKKAELAGVLIVAEGAHDPRLRLQLLKGVSALLDLPAHRIEIVPRKP